MHAIAVDYAKHGTNVDRRALDDIKVEEWPDFMEKDNKPSYKSTSILG